MKTPEAPEAPKRGRKPKTEEAPKAIDIGGGVTIAENVDGAALVVSCRASEREKVAQDVYAYLEGLCEPGQPVIIKNGACGSNVSFDDIETFPAKNRACGCGNKRHSIVRYKFI